MKEFLRYYARILRLSLAGILIGLCTGVVEGLFGLGLNGCSSIFQQSHLKLLLLLPVTGLVIMALFHTWGKPAMDRMNLIFEVDQHQKDHIPRRLATLMILSTWLTHLSGGSAGKEGVAVQVGATLSDWIRRILKADDEPGVFLVTGIAAGFAGLFQTPFTAVFFALEVLSAGTIRYRALAPSLFAAFAASSVSSLFGLQKAAFDVSWQASLTWKLGLLLSLLGIAYGLCGQIFARLLKLGHKLAVRFLPNPFVRVFSLSFVLMAVLFFWNQGRYAGLSTQLLEDCFAGKALWYDWAGKMLCTVLTLSIGFQGGEVTPLYTTGAALGAVLAPLLGLPAAAGAITGFAAVFGAGTNTFLAAIMLGMEIFGFSCFPYLFFPCAAAWLFNQNVSIYALQQITYK